MWYHSGVRRVAQVSKLWKIPNEKKMHEIRVHDCGPAKIGGNEQ